MMHSATATNYRNLLLQLKQLVTSRHLASVDSIANGGAGYVAGDVVTLSGGTSTHAATVRVLTAPGGVVATVKIVNGGAYTVDPTDPVSTTGGTGAGLTLNCTFDITGWVTKRYLTQIGLTAAVIANDGATYAANDILTLVGGTFVTAATIKVLTVDGGGNILTFQVNTPGEYTVAPSNPVSVTGGAGTGATFTCNFNGRVGQDELIVEGDGAASDQILVGARTYFDVPSDSHNWELAGFTGYVAGNTWQTQTGISPGRFDDQGTVPGGAFLPLPDASITYWVFATHRRIYVVSKASGNYASCHLGFLNQFGTASEFPYPLFVCGATSKFDERFSSSSIGFSSPVDPIKTGTALSIRGPGLYRRPDGVWADCFNSAFTGTTRTQNVDLTVYPAGTSAGTSNPPVQAEDLIVGPEPVQFSQIIPGTGVPGTQATRLKPTPMTTGDLTELWPATLIVSSTGNGLGVAGEMHQIYWISAENSMVAEDFLTIGDDRYRVFKSGSRGDIWSHFAVKED